MRQNLLLLLCLFFSSLVHAQILNIDKTDTSAYTRKPKRNLNFSSGVEIDKQKTTLYDATNTIETSWQQYKELFLLAGSYRFTYNGPDDILNSGYIHLRYRHAYRNRVQPEPFLQYQWDNKRGILHRFLSGANVRYNFAKGIKFSLNAGLGLMYESEEWNYIAVDSSKIPPNAKTVVKKLAKINSYVRFDWKASDNSDVAFNVFLQTRPGHFQPRIAPHVQWDIKAGKHIGFSIAFTGLYDTKPVVPIEKFYFSLSNSIVLNF